VFNQPGPIIKLPADAPRMTTALLGLLNGVLG
jgi:hypothetical protein